MKEDVSSADHPVELSPVSRPRVLVVDDDAPFQKLVQMWLKSDFDLLFLSSGQSLIEDIEALQPDILLLDMGLPGWSGPDLCRTLRSYDRFVSLPVIFMTAQADADHFLDHVTSGGDVFLAKNVDPALLRRTLWGLLERRENPFQRPI
jgi:putative two-component system response regulator